MANSNQKNLIINVIRFIAQISFLLIVHFLSTIKFLFNIYFKQTQETRKRIKTGIISGIIFFIILYKGSLIYTLIISLLYIVMILEMRKILYNMKEININYYYYYNKMGFYLITTVCSLLILIRFANQGFKILLWLFASIWSCDMFAYFGGKSFGKIKLSPSISPNKTYEGSICGIIGGLTVSLCFYFIYHTGHKNSFLLNNFIILSFIVLILSQISDLMESWVKRQCKVKDSGSILPGHGGLLDRFDSIFLPVILIFIIMFLNKNVIF